MDYLSIINHDKKFVFVILDCFCNRYFHSFNSVNGDIVFTDNLENCYKFFFRKSAEAVNNFLFHYLHFHFDIKEV